MQETWVQSLSLEDPLEKEMATHSNILDWKTPRTGEPGGLQSTELQRVRHDWVHTHWGGSTGRYEERQKLEENQNKDTNWKNNFFVVVNHSWSVVNVLKPVLLSLLIFQFSSVAQSCPTLCDHMNHSTPGLPVHHQHPEITQTHVHRVSDAIQPSHPLSSPSPPAPNPSQHQSLFLFFFFLILFYF